MNYELAWKELRKAIEDYKTGLDKFIKVEYDNSNWKEYDKDLSKKYVLEQIQLLMDTIEKNLL